MRKSYLDYAMSVIVSRALPDVRDGLKPVHRRILYAMMEGNYDWSKPPRKSARIVGDVMGNYHPHGDSSIYEAMVRMAQDFSMRLPLVDGQGNFGSVDGDPPAAMRYTESRLARAAESLLRDIDKETVDFTENYDETQLEPTVLPAEYPNLLVNGANGIAVGMATNIPPHNLGEVVDATMAMIDNPEITDDELIESTNVFQGQKVSPGDGALRDPRNWWHLRNPRTPSWGEPYRQIAARMTRAVLRARADAAGHEAVCVSHQLPVETLRRSMTGAALHHFPTKRMCNLASVTSFYFHDDACVGWGYAELSGQ